MATLPGGDHKQVAFRLREFAEHYAKLQGYSFGDGVTHEMPQTADRMAREIMERAAKRGIPLSDLIDAAEASLRTYIDAMIEAARADPVYARDNPGVIGEMTWAAARLKLCPIWPIC